MKFWKQLSFNIQQNQNLLFYLASGYNATNFARKNTLKVDFVFLDPQELLNQKQRLPSCGKKFDSLYSRLLSQRNFENSCFSEVVKGFQQITKLSKKFEIFFKNLGLFCFSEVRNSGLAVEKLIQRKVVYGFDSLLVVKLTRESLHTCINFFVLTVVFQR